jgi:hypothetical protein
MSSFRKKDALLGKNFTGFSDASGSILALYIIISFIHGAMGDLARRTGLPVTDERAFHLALGSRAAGREHMNQLVAFTDRTLPSSSPSASARPIASLNSSRRRSGIRTRGAPMRAPCRNSSPGASSTASRRSPRCSRCMSAHEKHAQTLPTLFEVCAPWPKRQFFCAFPHLASHLA